MKKVLVFLILGILLINLIGIVIADNNTKLVERPVEKSINTIQDDNKTELEDDSDDEDDETEEIETEFCGTSTKAVCETNNDCKTGGCSGQVCQGINENGSITTCEYLDCYSAEKYNMQCGCFKEKCQWKNKNAELERKRTRNITKEEIKEIVKERNRIKFEQRTGVECPEDCKCTGVTMKCRLEDGGREMTVYSRSGNIIVQVKNINATTQVTLYKYNNSVYGIFKGNETKKIILPDQIKEKVEERIRIKLENPNITLNEDGYYQIQTKKKARLFLLFPVREKIQLQLDAENGEVVKIRNPWWGFLAKDIEE